jgi:hypothetical protein
VTAKTKGLSHGLADVDTICNGFNLHRDAYYKFLKRNGKRILIEKQVVELVKKNEIFSLELALESCIRNFTKRLLKTA